VLAGSVLCLAALGLGLGCSQNGTKPAQGPYTLGQTPADAPAKTAEEPTPVLADPSAREAGEAAASRSMVPSSARSRPTADGGSALSEPIPVEPVSVQPLPLPSAPSPAESSATPQGTSGDRIGANGRPTQVMIDDGGAEGRTESLIEASRRAKSEKANAGTPIAVITDENLKDYAARGKLTMAQPGRPPAAAQGTKREATDAATNADTEQEVSEEDYWSQRVLDLRTAWRDAVDSIDELEGRAQKLRTEFYAADDPRYRDTRIKPAWDRALDQIAQARRDAARFQEELQVALEEGRRSGALPGWLRTGIELEPPPEAPIEDDLDHHDVSEPQIYGEPPP
jgi:hypothetical protein